MEENRELWLPVTNVGSGMHLMAKGGDGSAEFSIMLSSKIDAGYLGTSLETPVLEVALTDRPGDTIADKLKWYRARAGMKQVEVAKAIGINESTYIKYEQGTRVYTFENLQKIAAFYGVPYEEFQDEYMRFALNQKEILLQKRKALGLTQQQYAYRLEIPAARYQRWEWGRNVVREHCWIKYFK